ncbi:site-specific tyrosine recombinase/integron integrase [Lactobacillus amylovorus]|jgi:site-specific recombinase XerD|uniref:site-specific tyrosine recombinase/integron integrase n=1 Tax=Lactobacillus amylovorus TaxID=1604 RepID=UPI00232C41EC|nr:site-specific tyrosine recombinase/integron integrase [Lactobacillus amylovorus]MDB6232862.1 tyrosine-type recombinase/integrase [Lactobacillus amylovorus]
MNEKFIEIINDMADVLNAAQLKRLQEVLLKRLVKDEPEKKMISNQEYLNKFLEAKKIEGCSERTIKYYKVTVEQLLKKVLHPIRKVTTEQMREYLVDYQKINNCGKTTIDNVRRNISSFFSWLEEEDYILKSPMRRIHKIRAEKLVKNVITDEDIERLRDGCDCLRDVAMIDLLYSTGIRVGELVRLNRADINFSERECVVFGKGDKERRVYFDAKSKIHLINYLKSRIDDNPALFVSLDKPYNRLKISGVEIRLRQLGRKLHLDRVHPHKFRRSMATRAIDKGMPIEQVQKILGHSQIDTTMQYAIVNQNNVKAAHRKYIS